MARDGIDISTFKRIFLEHWDDFKAAYSRFDTDQYTEAVQKMLDCGDPEKMGFVQYRCMACGQTRRIGFSCKSCFCLSCARVYTDRWSDFIGRRLFPGVTYRHTVLTVPDFLHEWFYRDATLLNPFMVAGHACLQDIFHTATGVQLDIGSIIVVQTAGRSGHYNPHLHILHTAGGLNPRGQWQSVSYIPYEILHKKWQYHLLTMLREHVSDPAIQKDIDRAWNKYPNGLVAYLQPGEVPPGGEGLAQYLAKYVVSPPIAVRRIEEYDGENVRYWYQDHKTKAVQHETLPVLRFIGRMVQHILPKGFQRIRYYGLHGNVRYQKVREQLERLLPTQMQPDPRGYRVLPRKSFPQLFFEAFGEDPLLCPRCGKPMDRELISHPDHGIIKDYGLFDMETYIDPELPERAARVVEAEAPRHALAPAHGMGQLPLPFM